MANWQTTVMDRRAYAEFAVAPSIAIWGKTGLASIEVAICYQSTW